MEPKKFEGLSGMLRAPTPWLAGEDINGLGDIEVMIEDVLMYDEVQFDAGRKEKNVPTLKFAGKQKQLVLRTATNRRALVAAFGTDTKKWRNQKIFIYFDPTVRMKGQQVGGIRIRVP
jgi:hypothetical protein